MADRSDREFSVEQQQPVFPIATDGSDPRNCLFWDHGNIVTANEPTDAVIVALLAIAPQLQATVQDSNFVRVSDVSKPA